MKGTVFFCLLASSLLLAQAKFVQQTMEEKESRRDLRFLVTFDQYHAGARPAGGDNMPCTIKDLNLQLRGTIGFDGAQAYRPVVGEDLRYRANGNADFREGTLVMWVCANDYEPGSAGAKTRGNVAYSQLMFKQGKRFVEFRLYEYDGLLYWDWYSSEPPFRYVDVGRVSAPLKSVRKGEWFQVAASWGRTLALYLNGEQIQEKGMPAKAAKSMDLKPENEKSFIGVKNCFHHDFHKNSDTRVDDYGIYSRQLSPVEIRNQYLALLLDKEGKRTELFGMALNGVDRGHGMGADTLEVAFDFVPLPDGLRSVLDEGLLEMAYTLAAPDGGRQSGIWHFAKDEDTKILENIVQTGKYSLTVTLDQGNGVKYTATAEVERPDMSFLGNHVGDEDKVPEIWREFAVEDGRVRLWNRIYDMPLGQPLPAQILVKGRALLESAPLLLVNGQPVTQWRTKGTLRTNRTVTYEGTGEIPGCTLSYRTVVEYDGLIRFSFLVHGKPKVDDLRLEWQVKPEFCQFLMRPHVYEGREDPAEFLYDNGMEDSLREIWLVTEELGGFAYAVEHDGNWVYDAKQPVYRVSRKTGKCQVRMIARPVEIPEGAEYHALFIATPTRPFPTPFRCIRHGDPASPYPALLTQYGSEGVLTGISTFEPTPLFAKKFGEAREHSLGMYGMADAMTEASAHARYFRKYWESPGAAGYTFRWGQLQPDGSVKKIPVASISACNATCQPDLYLWNIRKMLDGPGGKAVCAIYYDLCGAGVCASSLHGCRFQDCFGREIRKLKLLNKRRLLERTVQLAHSRGKWVWCHQQRDYFPMLQGLADYVFPGEQYESIFARNPYPFNGEIPEIMFRSELNREVIGTGVVLWTTVTSQARAKLPENEKKRMTEAMCSMTLAYDIDATVAFAYGPVLRKIWNVFQEFDVGNATTVFHRFDRQKTVKADSSAVLVSWYECPGGKRVVVICNPDVKTVKTVVDFGTIAPQADTLLERYNDTRIPLSGGKATLRISPRSFHIFAF
ncbi:MAG: hypothetical protein IJJ33_17865 [Victivallales bacterium]|nr:hypothetical protein [Victivallales bacterium]